LDMELVKQSFQQLFQYMVSASPAQVDRLNTYCIQIVGFCDISLGDEFQRFCAEKGAPANSPSPMASKIVLLEWMKRYEGRVLEYLENLDSHKNILIENAKKYVQQNTSARIMLNDVADHLKISAGYLSSLFTKYEKIHFIDYVNNVKMQEAKKMLRSGNYKIYQIAYMLGYENSSYFSRIFKKVTGCAPKEISF